MVQETQIPSSQYAVIFEKTGGPLLYKQIPTPEPRPDEVLVNIKYSGVCHTDLHAWKGDWPFPTKLPLVGGHEGAGVVVKVGSLVKEVNIGDHVGVKWINSTCLECGFCDSGDEQICAKAQMSGYTVDGSFQQYCVAKAANIAKIPKDVPLDGVSPILCGGLTVYRALKESGIKPGQYVAIVGAGGGLGSLGVQYAKAMGCRVIAIDAGEEKAALVKELGAESYVDFMKTKDIVAEVRAATEDGLGPQAAVLVAVVEKPFQQAALYVRPLGTVVVVGLPANAYLKAPVFESVLKMVTIKASYVGNRTDTVEAIDFYRRGLVKSPIKVVGLSELPKVYELMEKGQIAGRYVLDTSK